MAKIVLLGYAGQLGNAIGQQLNALGLTYQGYDRTQLDITNPHQLIELFSNAPPEIVINCAAYTSVDLAETERDLCSDINEHAVANIANLCRENNTFLMHFSTDYVFDGAKKHPYVEEDTPNPINHYGTSKLAGEKAIVKICSKYCIIRTSWLYGVFGKNFRTKILQQAVSQKTLNVISDQLGTPTQIAGLAAAVAKIVQHYHAPTALPYGIYHFSDSTVMSWFQLAKAILKEANNNCVVMPISALTIKSPAKRPNYSALNCHKLQQWLLVNTAKG